MIATSGLAADYTMKVSHVVSASTPKGKAADFFEKRVEEIKIIFIKLWTEKLEQF